MHTLLSQKYGIGVSFRKLSKRETSGGIWILRRGGGGGGGGMMVERQSFTNTICGIWVCLNVCVQGFIQDFEF